MIRCNLSVLLAERNLRITKVSKDTGISRTTLTSLASNHSQGIQFDTINNLCNYLKIKPEQLISYVPVDINIKHVRLDGEQLDIDLNIIQNNKSFLCGLTGECYAYSPFGLIDELDVSIYLWGDDDDDDIKEENLLISNAFKKLPVPFLNDIQNRILEEILSNLDEEKISDNLTYTLTFDDKLIADN